MELSRKLIMSGLLGLVGRGTIGQAVLAVVLAFIFFAIALKHQPFTSGRLNFLKICSEAQLFAVLVLCLVIQAVEIGSVGLSTETITIDGYGVIMVVVATVAVPIALGSICLISKDVRNSRKPDNADTGAADGTASGTGASDAAATGELRRAVLALPIGTESAELRRAVAAVLALLPDAAEEARPADLDPETFEQDFTAASSASRSAPAGPIPARPTAQRQQVRRRARRLFALAYCRRPPSVSNITC